MRLKFLRVDDVLKLVDPLFGVLHVRSQVAVEETEGVAVERQADGHGSFVALRDTRAEKREALTGKSQCLEHQILMYTSDF